MINVQAASVFGELLDPIISIIFRGFIKAMGCQSECSNTELSLGAVLLIIVLVAIFLLIYIFVRKKPEKIKAQRKRRTR